MEKAFGQRKGAVYSHLNRLGKIRPQGFFQFCVFQIVPVPYSATSRTQLKIVSSSSFPIRPGPDSASSDEQDHSIDRAEIWGFRLLCVQEVAQSGVV